MQLIDALRQDLNVLTPLLATSEGRRVLTEHDPLLFALLYFPHHLEDPNTGEMTLCDFHLDLIEWAKSWARPSVNRKENRACFIAPRQSGKSTWIFLLLPMWAAAHGHRKFVAAFSDSEQQAITHLFTFKQELDNNERLQQDFPELTNTHKNNAQARAMMDNRNQTMRANGFIFMAKGADSAALGMKVGQTRPDVLLFDDIEPGESNYSEYEARKRKETLISDLFALNHWAVVAIVGTTTMPNSLIDQMRKVQAFSETYDGPEDLYREAMDHELRWVIDERINVHYWPVVLEREGLEVSLWPERWSMDSLNADRGTREFAKNMMNRPVSLDGGYWDDEDIDIDRPEYYRRTIICVDPAVTTAKRSDFTGIAVVSLGSDNLVYVRYASQHKINSDTLAHTVTELVNEYEASMVVVETNQGGDLWKQVFKDIPCKYRGLRAKGSKEIRVASAADFYKRNQVKHTNHFPVAEEQMLAFPRVTHDDVVDAITTGVLVFKKYARRGGVSATQQKYTKEVS